ncbi:MAG TPA: hypothetical protein VKV16_09625 [Solirubrobacteraceae bacterium]|nr:hypothetical protein [Solirubrobacteraceae bacterium]
MTRITFTLALLASVALLVTGCGGSSSTAGVAHISSNTSTSADASSAGGSSPSESSVPTQQKLVAYAQCMRSHGVPEFPEPTEGKLLLHSEVHDGHVSGVDPQSSQFQAASKACEKLAPNGGKPPSAAEQTKVQEKALRFSECMRSHGVPDFPDPEVAHGGVGMEIHVGGKKGGPGAIDPNSPQFRSAQKACQSIMGGPKDAPEGAVVAAP